MYYPFHTTRSITCSDQHLVNRPSPWITAWHPLANLQVSHGPNPYASHRSYEMYKICTSDFIAMSIHRQKQACTDKFLAMVTEGVVIRVPLQWLKEDEKQLHIL